MLSSILGFPRFGANRDLKFLVESFWAGKVDETALLDGAKDAAITFNAIPARYQNLEGLAQYFAMARGLQNDSVSVPSLPMSKFFDTNYHYTRVTLSESPEQLKLAKEPKAVREFLEAKALGIKTRPAIIGPVSFILLSTAGASKLQSHLPNLTRAYSDLLLQLASAGAEWVQLDEPFLCMDLTQDQKAAFTSAYTQLASHLAGKGPKVLIANYFEALADNAELAFSLPGVAAVHLDLVRGEQQADAVLDLLERKKDTTTVVSLGVVNGRNIWKADLEAALKLVNKFVSRVGADRLIVSSSCSLLHSPHSLEAEYKGKHDAEILDWLAFAVEKVREIKLISRAVAGVDASVTEKLDANKRSIQSRRTSTRIHNPAVQQEMSAVDASMLSRSSPYPTRRTIQQGKLHLPKFPTTTIGSFPQTADVRRLRAQHKNGTLTTEQYEAKLKEEIERVVRFQEELDIDVLVHGEPERNDMVEYFGEQMDGLTFTKNGWVQSYGTRGVKPPIIYGDVSRPNPMTVRWSAYAQSLTKRPMKGMLTGPLTILCWSFVRDDQPRELTAKQLALAVRREVVDLEAAGIAVIQIDEPAIREGLPLRRSKWDSYLTWAVDAFKLSSCGVRDETQIHSHMCYSDFEDIMDAIIALDCDVLSIESAKSDLKLLKAFESRSYPNELGPGVFDIHTKRVCPADEMLGTAQKMLTCLSPERVWINPDCGLKTRGWEETTKVLTNMVSVSKQLRAASTA
ncbi:hypothetical protein HK101_001743 [Irineochytrium annulatum]|nr:hypothetical protein HK101_001743 [Irineochytrium annulatum]